MPQLESDSRCWAYGEEELGKTPGCCGLDLLTWARGTTFRCRHRTRSESQGTLLLNSSFDKNGHELRFSRSSGGGGRQGRGGVSAGHIQAEGIVLLLHGMGHETLV